MVTQSEALACYPGAITFSHGDSVALNAEILALIRTGQKTMTCDVWDQFAASGEPLPEVGRVDIALTFDGQPAFALRTVKVEKIRFCDMDESRIAPQGEFTDLADWQAGYRAYLTRAGLFHPEVEMMVETFEVVEVFE